MRIYLVSDYKGHFGSKYNDFPYRSGFDQQILCQLFKKDNFDAIFINPSDPQIKGINFTQEIVLYTSQEDKDLHFKSFLEDFINYVSLKGAKVIPSLQLFRAHENKVFFEMLRDTMDNPVVKNINSDWYGTYEDFVARSAEYIYPIVIKSFNGSMSRGVKLAKNQKEALRAVYEISRSDDLNLRTRDGFRFIRHSGYIKESWNRKKFLVQEFIPGLSFDYKVLIYGSKYYVIKRDVKPGDFRASGMGRLSFVSDIPDGLLDFSEACFAAFKAPHASFDIACSGHRFYLLEAQFVYFGTYTIECSNFYFVRGNDKWEKIETGSVLEEEYVNSIIQFIKNEGIVCL